MATTTSKGLYDARFEHASCGVAFVADLRRGPSHEIVDLALSALENLAHRGAFGADPETGDGAGILLQMPHALFSAVAGVLLPAPGAYASGMAYLPADPAAAARAKEAFGRLAGEEGLGVLAWRTVPVELGRAGAAVQRVAPRFEQVFRRRTSSTWAPSSRRRSGSVQR